MYYYCLTLRKTRKPVYVSHYDEKLLKLHGLSYVTVHSHYESEKGLHFHAMIESQRKLYVKTLLKLMDIQWGWSVRFEECKFYDIWHEYCIKNAKLESDLLDLEMAKELEDATLSEHDSGLTQYDGESPEEILTDPDLIEMENLSSIKRNLFNV